FIDLAAGEFPGTRKVLAGGTLREQHAATRIAQHARDDVERRPGHARPLTRVPGDPRRLTTRSMAARASGELAVALLVLLARTAGTGVVAADLRPLAVDRRLREAGLAGALRRLGLDRGEATGLGVLELHRTRLRFGLLALLALERFDLVLAADARAGDHLDDLVLEARQHAFEQFERLALELLLRLLLRVAAQVDALAQVIHAGQVLLPAVVEHGQHDVLLEPAHDFRTDHRLLLAEQ